LGRDPRRAADRGVRAAPRRRRALHPIVRGAGVSRSRLRSRAGARGGPRALESAVCAPPLAGAALFIRSFAALAYRDLGFDRGPVLVAAVDATRSSVPPASRLPMFERPRPTRGAPP